MLFMQLVAARYECELSWPAWYAVPPPRFMGFVVGFYVGSFARVRPVSFVDGLDPVNDWRSIYSTLYGEMRKKKSPKVFQYRF